jgi:hypothetical protein
MVVPGAGARLDDGDPVTLASHTQPGHGTLSLEGFHGLDSFTYTVSD